MPTSSISILTHLDSSCEDLFACLYNLTSSDLNLLRILLKYKTQEEGFTLDSLAKQTNKDKGTVFRSLQKLVGLDFCTKHVKILKEGGYYHVYKAAEIIAIEKSVDYRIKEVQQSLNRIRKRFREDIKRMVLQ
jgi:predicted transcriptional regulator